MWSWVASWTWLTEVEVWRQRTVLKQAFSPLDGEKLLNQPQLGVWETAQHSHFYV